MSRSVRRFLCVQGRGRLDTKDGASGTKAVPRLLGAQGAAVDGKCASAARSDRGPPSNRIARLCRCLGPNRNATPRRQHDRSRSPTSRRRRSPGKRRSTSRVSPADRPGHPDRADPRARGLSAPVATASSDSPASIMKTAITCRRPPGAHVSVADRGHRLYPPHTQPDRVEGLRVHPVLDHAEDDDPEGPEKHDPVRSDTCTRQRTHHALHSLPGETPWLGLVGHSLGIRELGRRPSTTTSPVRMSAWFPRDTAWRCRRRARKLLGRVEFGA